MKPVAFLGLIFTCLFALPNLAKADQPSMVIYISDDHSQVESQLYGNADIPMPHLEQLAKDGMTFQYAFVASPSCAPSRAAMLTGLMPVRNGAQANHTYPHDHIHSLIVNLKSAGYQTAAFGKVSHGKDSKRYGFDHISTNSNAQPLLKDVTKYLQQPHTKPQCLFVGINSPHVPWSQAPPHFQPVDVHFPPHHIDTPDTRNHRAWFYDEIKQIDDSLGELRTLTQQHLGDNLLFIYTSDHGSQWPFGKWTLYDYGIRVPFVAAWPEHIPANVNTEAMISWIDLIPTLIEIAGGQAQPEIDGQSFASVLLGEKSMHRTRIFTTNTGDGVMNVYPERSIRDQEYKLIHNLHPEFAFTNHTDIDRKPAAGAYWTQWAEKAKIDPTAQAILDRYYQRPEWELYDTWKDPWELYNLAEDPAQKTRLNQMKEELAEWMKQNGDEGLVHNKPRLISQPESWHPDLVKPPSKPK